MQLNTCIVITITSKTSKLNFIVSLAIFNLLEKPEGWLKKEKKAREGQTQNHLQETRTITRGNDPELSTTLF